MLLKVNFWIGLSNSIKSWGNSSITVTSALAPPLPIAEPNTLIAGIVEIKLIEKPAKVMISEDIKIAFADNVIAFLIASNLGIVCLHVV